MADNVTLVTGASGFLGKAVMKLLAEQKQHAIGLDPRASATTQVVDDLSDRSKSVAWVERRETHGNLPGDGFRFAQPILRSCGKKMHAGGDTNSAKGRVARTNGF